MMRNVMLSIGLTLSSLVVFSAPSYANTPAKAVTKQSLAKQELIDMQQLKVIWKKYQQDIQQMQQVIPSLQAEKDQAKRNARVYTFNRNLEQSKAALKRLVLADQTAIKLRQGITNHATKYQNVFKLATLDKLSGAQRSTLERLNAQTNALYQNMQKTASQLPKS
ncbi:hypothetical protein SAMN05421749_102301 [Acinetobacter marinus]|uniref:LTXXQ motif family protein n=1 Tax=Acinetobacter marinus TaxID=281375 RepID=A0A1G6HIG7_9GAMM|nr:hypothetical protein SAMN05421749_102301 [Acinetobacter marinus]